MKIHKKIGIGLSLFLMLGVGLFHAQKVFASPVNNDSFANATYEISAFENNKPETVLVTIDGKQYAFSDRDTKDDIDNLKFYGDSSFICNQKNAPRDYGITVTGQPKLVTGGAKAYPATIKLFHWTNTDEECKDGQTNVLLEPTSINLRYDSNTPGAPLISPGSTSDIASPPAHYWINPKDTSVIHATIDDSSYTFTKGTGWTYKPVAGEFCPNSTGITTGDLSQINLKSVSNLLAKIEVKLPDNGSCSKPVSASENINIDVTEDPNGTPACTGSNCPEESGGTTGVTGEGTCEPNSGSSALTWITCPLLEIANSLAIQFTEFFEDQLSFTLNQNVRAPNGQQSLERAWSVIKNLASAIIVILMLVMVISQAIGTGLFEAYTVKKMLPKLVAAVILIQISWPLVVWAINIVDDLGNGLADIMYAPFGGKANMDLEHLMHNAGVSSWTAGAFSWVGLVGGIVVGVAAAPIVLAGAFAAFISLLVGIGALIFRKILIIACLILAPIAIAAWVMPGNQKLWKLWYDNLSKALLMFPFIVLIIAAGRIFAWVSGTQTGDYAQLIGFFFVLVGFFGPLFLLPKAFKWGGAAMRVAGGAMSNLAKPVSEKGGAGLKGISERWQGKRAKKYDTTTKGVKGFLGRGVRRVQSGHMIPFSERSRRLTIASGNKWAEERNEEAMALALRTQEKALAGYDYADMDNNGNFLKYSKRKNAAGQYLDVAGNIVDEKDAAYLNAAGNHLDAAGNPISKAHAHSVQVADRKDATFEHLTGVAAGKQALIDIAGNDGKSETAKRAAQAADKLLIDTHSEIELQKSRVQYGANRGRRASETAIWRETITNSPQHYSAINSSRPDLAPDVIETAQNRLRIKYEDADAAQRQQLDIVRLHEALDRLTPEQMQQAHYGLYQDITKTGDTGLAQKLQDKITYFNDKAGVIGVNAVGSLRGGREEYVDAALGLLGSMPGAPPGAAPRKLSDVVP